MGNDSSVPQIDEALTPSYFDQIDPSQGNAFNLASVPLEGDYILRAWNAFKFKVTYELTLAPNGAAKVCRRTVRGPVHYGTWTVFPEDNIIAVVCVPIGMMAHHETPVAFCIYVTGKTDVGDMTVFHGYEQKGGVPRTYQLVKKSRYTHSE